MDQVLGDLPFCFVCIDNILIFNRDLSSHVVNLHKVFLLCGQHGLTIGLPKCEFALSKIEFLGHLLSTTQCSPLSKHSAAISAFPPPSDKLALQRSLGMIKYYRKILHGAAHILDSLTDALKGPDKSLSWSLVLDSAFTRARDLLSSIPELVNPHPDTQGSLAVDASNTHLSAVLQQLLGSVVFLLQEAVRC